MGEEGKKISFGFSKLAKKTSILPSKLNQIKPEKTKIEFIDCLEGKSIKLKDPTQPQESLLVIPLKQCLGSNINSIDNQTNVTDKQIISDSISSQNETPKDIYTNKLINNSDPLLNVKDEKLTLDQIAAKEILEEVNKKAVSKGETRVINVPLTNSALDGEKESTVDDYDSVPVNEFGLAMLRGMGWAPGKGIGKNEKVVTTCLPPVRPKGMGLGADKYVKPQIENSATGDNLKMTKGSYIRVVAGIHKDNYGQIEGFDDESGRVIVKLVLQNLTVSLNEFMIQLVDKTEFTKNSKVINVGKYEQYKHKEEMGHGIQDKAVKCSSVSNKTKNEEFKYHNSDISDSEDSSKTNKIEKSGREKHSPLKKSREKQAKSWSRSNTSSPEGREIDIRVHSKSKSKPSNLKEYGRNSFKEINSCKKKSKYRHTSSSSSSSSDSHYNDSKKHRVKDSKNNSRRLPRDRSRSPRKQSSHSKHKKSKYR